MCNDKINPIENIINEYQKDEINRYKIQLLKLLANSSYNNPIYSIFGNMFDFVNEDKIKYAKLIAEQYAKETFHDKTDNIAPVVPSIAVFWYRNLSY